MGILEVDIGYETSKLIERNKICDSVNWCVYVTDKQTLTKSNLTLASYTTSNLGGKHVGTGGSRGFPQS